MKIYTSFIPVDKMSLGMDSKIAPLFDQLSFQTLETYKYKIMWNLRDIESEMEWEKGQIILELQQNHDLKIIQNGFTAPLSTILMLRLNMIKAEEPFIIHNYIPDEPPQQVKVKLWRRIRLTLYYARENVRNNWYAWKGLRKLVKESKKRR
jgi:hypothetical protein